MNVTTIPKKTITVITPTKKRVDKEKYNQLRVAAYCRVSTDSEEQLTSYTMQKKVYTEMIMEKPEWCLVDIYADEGISGTKAVNRHEFQRMMKDCKRGKIDYIITKSVSRFARNTAECLEFVRQLKLMGIGVIFEEQNIDTLKMDGELLITIHAGFAQAESESMSKNITWAFRKRFENGEVVFNYKKMVGYRKGANGPEIIPEEAEIIRTIFDMYIAGMTLREIVDKLLEEGVPTKCGKVKWSAATIQSILKNEKYCGDAILQKTITIDCIEKIHKKNEGEAPMYYVRDNHPAIVSRKTFNKAQEEMARRACKRSPSQKGSVTGQGKYSKYALSEVLHCGTCGTKYRRTTWCKNGKKRVVWRCCSRLDFGTQFCKDSPTLDETELHAAIVRAMGTFSKEDYEIFHQSILETMPDAIGMFEDTSEAGVIKSQIESLNQGMMELVELSIKEGLSVEESEESFQRISEEIAQLEARLEAIRTAGQSESERQEGILRLQASVNELKNCTSEYNDNAVRQMIECIKVYPTGKLEVIFAGGYTVAEHIDLKKG